MSSNFFETIPRAETLGVLETCERVASLGRQVRIDPQALKGFAKELAAATVSRPGWDTARHFFDGGEKTVAYLLVLDSLNFCFWPAEGTARWEVDYGDEGLSGYFGLAAALKRAVEAGLPIWQPEFLARLDPAGLERLLAGRGELQLMDKRLAILRETGRGLMERYQGRPLRLIEAAGGSALALVRLVIDAFPSFRDTTVFLGKPVFFYKRAQILASDLYGAFGGQGWGTFHDIDRLTAFADYKLPQVLRHLGILDYSETLARKIDRRQLLEPGSPEEVEIRANTIWAVELIKREMAGLDRRARAFEIDWLLWNLGQQDTYRKKPYHRTRTIYY